MEEADVDMLRKDVDVPKGRILDTRRGVAVVQEFGDILSTASHLRKPLPPNEGKFGALRIEPPIDLRLVSYGTVESKEAGHKLSPMFMSWRSMRGVRPLRPNG